MTSPLFGVDLGGTKIEGVVLMPDGSEVLRHRVATPGGDYRATLHAIGALIDHLEAQSGQVCQRVGIGIPGSVSPQTGLVRNANSTCLNGRDLPGDLVRLLGREIRINNDANCLALSEIRDGAACGTTSAFAVILGTGVGGGLVIDNKIVTGAHGLGGEWGHVPLAQEAPRETACYCGRYYCNEMFLSGPSIVAAYRRKSGKKVPNVQAVAKDAGAGEPLAIDVLATFGQRLARALGTIVNIVDPEVIILAGGVSNLDGLVENLARDLRPHIFASTDDGPDNGPDNGVEIPIKRAQWGDSSGVRGAARLWEDVT